jgi:carbamoyl-phosphate synthase / aspartate carbamoyltransferase
MTVQLPPQDLDEETVAKIVKATQLIANALNVTGPFNIQFIAKAREIKVRPRLLQHPCPPVPQRHPCA